MEPFPKLEGLETIPQHRNCSSLLEMAESVSIILDYLRQHNFERAEAALRSELQAQQVSAGPVSSLPRDNSDHDKLVKEEFSPCMDNSSPSHESSYRDGLYVDRLTALSLQSKPEPSVSQGFGSTITQQRPMREHVEWDFGSHSNHNSMCAPRKQYSQLRNSSSQFGLHRSNHDKQGVGPRSWKDWVTDQESPRRINGVQNEEEDFLVGSHNVNSAFSQQQHHDTGRILCRSDLLQQETCEKQMLKMDNWEEPENASWQERRENFLQQDMGTPQLKKCTTVHGTEVFSEKTVCKDKAKLLQSSLREASDINLKSLANSAYSASIENGWWDYGIPGDNLLKPSNVSQSFCLPFSASEGSAGGFEQQEEKQMVHNCVDYLKTLGKERQTNQVDFLKDLILPWEVGFSNGFEQGENFVNESQTEDFFTVHPAKFTSANKDLHFKKENDEGMGFDRMLDTDNQGYTNPVFEQSFNLGSFLDIPVGQDIALSGDKQDGGIGRLPSQHIMQDTPELLSGFATLGDEPSDSGVGYLKDYWDSDTYEDDEDPGYHRQPIEDEAWFLAHEIDYPSDDNRARSNREKAVVNSIQGNERGGGFLHEEEEESYFSGEQFYNTGQSVGQALLGHDIFSITSLFGQSSLNDGVTLNQIGNMSYDGQLMDAEELKLMGAEPVWKGFSSQVNEHVLPGGEESSEDMAKSHEKHLRGRVRYIDMEDSRSEPNDNMAAVSGELERETSDEQRMQQGHRVFGLTSAWDNNLHNPQNDAVLHCIDCTGKGDGLRSCSRSDLASRSVQAISKSVFSASINKSDEHPCLNGFEQDDKEGHGPGLVGFSFLSPSSTCDMAVSKSDSGNSIWLTENILLSQDTDAYGVGITGPDDTLTSWKQESHESSPISPRNESYLNAAPFVHSKVSAHFAVDHGSHEPRDEVTEVCSYNDDRIDVMGVDDGGASTVQEELQQTKAEEDDFEVFSLRIVHRKNRTGFEEEKHFPIVINSVVAGRYLVTEQLGSAAFSKAVQARDLQTGMDVCMKIIKNNKDFFDQSLDEIKLLKFVNKHDPADKHHILRLYDYFYYREHLFIVCELLRANLYEFQKFNRESGGEVYFTMPRLQLITRQCLEALEFLHSLGLIHCDLKPENILVKSYSRCEVKVIDLGSSCFQTDHLCLYVQSRSYRAPEVILGLPYDQKIDIWSLGCILAELCSGNVLFQNDSLATLLARVVGIIGPIMPDMIIKGCDAHKYFTKNFMLYDQNQGTNKLEYLVPKKTSLRHRLPTGDQGFVDFVGYLLQVHPENRPSASEALKHPWLTYPYEPILT